MATENLKVKITADASQAKAEIGKFKDSLKGVVSGSTSATAAIGKTTAALGGLLIAVKAVKKAVNTAIEVAATGDAIKDNAQKVFMSTTAYQEWGYVLKQNGIEISALKVGMRQFSQKVAAGDEALAKYGITASNVEDAFGQAISTIQNMSTETEKIAAATELFGSRALELFPILNLTNQETQNLMDSYRLLGGTMSNELIALSDTCSDSIMAMKVAWGGLANLLAQALLPTIIKIIQWLTLLIAKIRIVLSAVFGIKSTFGPSNKKNSIAGASASTAKSTGGTAKNLGKAAKKAKELRRTLMGIDELSRLAEKATAAAAGGGGGGGGGVGGVGDVGGGGLGDFSDILTDDQLANLQTFEEKIEKIKGILNGVYEIFKGIVDIAAFGKLSEGVELIKSGLSKIWENLKEIFPGLQKVEDAWNTIKDKAATFKISLSDTFSAAWAKIKDAWNGIKDKAATAKLALSDAFSAAWNKVKGVWNGIKNKSVTISIGFKNALSHAWNSLASKVNAARKKSSIVKKLLPNFPKLAQGGILTSPTAAIMGEYAGARQNPEIATPQSLMYETIQRANGDLVSAFATMTRQVIAAIENKDLEVNIGDEQIARSAQRGNTAYYNRTGKALLTI